MVNFWSTVVFMERGTRIELVTLAWKARVIPFYEPRVFGGVYWDRTSRAVGAGFTVQCITIDASTPCSVTYSLNHFQSYLGRKPSA